jgi:hypothetical protein
MALLRKAVENGSSLSWNRRVHLTQSVSKPGRTASAFSIVLKTARVLSTMSPCPVAQRNGSPVVIITGSTTKATNWWSFGAGK